MKTISKTEKDTPVKKGAENQREELKTEPPLSEKDEVKKAEEKTKKPHPSISKGEG